MFKIFDFEIEFSLSLLDEMKGLEIDSLHAVYFDENVTLVPRTSRSGIGLSQVNETITISSKLVSTLVTQVLKIIGFFILALFFVLK